MKKATQFRLDMLRNGFHPVLNDCKAAVETGWPKLTVDEAEILSWDRSLLASTGMLVDSDLGVIDVDVEDAALVAQLADAIGEKHPELFTRGLVRHAGGPKEAWIARVDEPFGHLASRKWHRAGEDPKDPLTGRHVVECFGSLRGRQFGIDGPHTKVNGEVVRTYAFTADASPATVSRSALPVLPKAAFAAACNLFDGIAKAAGLVVVEGSKQHCDNGARTIVFDLTDEMTFDDGRCAYQLGELDDQRIYMEHNGGTFRVTSAFLGDGGSNSTKCIVGYSRRYGCVCIHNFETGVTHMPARAKGPDPRISKELGAQLLALDPLGLRRRPAAKASTGRRLRPAATS
jgi:hypothetical protein